MHRCNLLMFIIASFTKHSLLAWPIPTSVIAALTKHGLSAWPVLPEFSGLRGNNRALQDSSFVWSLLCVYSSFALKENRPHSKNCPMIAVLSTLLARFLFLQFLTISISNPTYNRQKLHRFKIYITVLPSLQHLTADLDQCPHSIFTRHARALLLIIWPTLQLVLKFCNHKVYYIRNTLYITRLSLIGKQADVHVFQIAHL